MLVMDLGTLGLIVGALGLGGTAFAVAKFFMDRGKNEAKADAALTSAAAAHAKIEMLSDNLSNYKVKAATEFASSHELANAVNNLGTRFDRMADRLDRVLETVRPHT